MQPINEIKVSGYVNSDLYEAGRVVYFFLRIGKGKTIKCLAFDETPPIERGMPVVVEGRLAISEYNGTTTYAIAATNVTPLVKQSKQAYSKQYNKYPNKPKYDKPKYDKPKYNI